jgi:hypothetical protein
MASNFYWKMRVAVLIVWLLVPLGTEAQNRPDFSGWWKLDAAKSDIEEPNLKGALFHIEHRDPAFRIARTLVYGGETKTMNFDLRTDGRPVEVRYGEERLVLAGGMGRCVTGVLHPRCDGGQRRAGPGELQAVAGWQDADNRRAWESQGARVGLPAAVTVKPTLIANSCGVQDATHLTVMKRFIVVATMAVFGVTGLVAQTGAKGDLKQAGEDTKDAGKSVGRATKKGAQKTTHAAKKGVHKGADATAKGANKVKEKTSTP